MNTNKQAHEKKLRAMEQKAIDIYRQIETEPEGDLSQPILNMLEYQFKRLFFFGKSPNELPSDTNGQEE